MPSRVIVSADNPHNTHDISLDDGVLRYGFRLDGDAKGIREISQTPSTLHLLGTGTKFGDWEPSFSHLEQTTWEGGRGLESFSSDPTRYFDASGVWTLTPGRILPGLRWVLARGLRNTDGFNHDQYSDSPDTAVGAGLSWRALHGTYRYAASSFSASASYNADKAYVWLRRVGSPGTCTLELRSDSGSNTPGAVLKSATVTTTTITDTLSVYQKFDWTTTQALTSGTTYWISVSGASTDNAGNHWEVGVAAMPLWTFYRSSDGTTWVDASASGEVIIFRVFEADTRRKFHFFELDGQMYAVSENADGTASKLYQHGYRGKATSATSTTIVDTNNTFTTLNNYRRVTVRIVRGTGAGQIRRAYCNNAANTLTLVDTPSTWDITPSTDSEYVVYSADLWREITGHGITGVVRDVTVVNNIAWFAQGNSINLRMMRFNAGAAPPAHEFADDGTSKADLLSNMNNPADGVRTLWRAVNASGSNVEVSFGAAPAWGGTTTFGTVIPIGEKTYLITRLIPYDGKMHVLKEDSLWELSTAAAPIPSKIPVDLDALASPTNGTAALAKDLFLYFNFSHSVQQYYGTTLNDLGPWKGTGLPAGRRGVVAALEGGVGMFFAAIDARETGTSSVLAYDGRGWHEIYRAHESGQRVQNIGWQACPGFRPRLWVSVGGDLAYVEFPLNAINPENDTTLGIIHEGYVESSTVVMGAHNLPQYFRSVVVSGRGLGDSVAEGGFVQDGNVAVDVQLDADVGSTTWRHAGTIYSSPEDRAMVNEGSSRALRYRLRFRNSEALAEPKIYSVGVEGFARTPVRYQYQIRVRLRDGAITEQGGVEPHPDEVIRWLKKVAGSAERLLLRSRWPRHDNQYVVVEPATILPETKGITDQESDVVTFVVREA